MTIEHHVAGSLRSPATEKLGRKTIEQRHRLPLSKPQSEPDEEVRFRGRGDGACGKILKASGRIATEIIAGITTLPDILCGSLKARLPAYLLLPFLVPESPTGSRQKTFGDSSYKPTDLMPRHVIGEP